MHIIVDGYNILKQVLHNTHISLEQRRAFINMLGKYAAKKNHQIAVVFDGGPTVWPQQEKDHGVTVLYSGTKQSADEIIMGTLEKKRHNLLVVSSDHEIQRAARTHGLATMNAIEFYTLVRQELQSKQEKKPTGIIKTTGEENELLDMLMQNAMQPMHKTEDQESQERHSHGKKLSKKERVYLQKIKKL